MKKVLLLASVLTLLGAGCSAATDKVVNDALLPVSVPVAALKEAKDVTAEANAAANEQNDLMSDEAVVALALLDGAAVPKEAEIKETFGCNDRLALVKVPKKNTDRPLADNLTALFAIGDKPPAGLHNGLSGSKLKVDGISVAGGVTEVRLSGTVTSAGECDDPRIKAQIEGTIRRLRPKFKILLNGSESAYRCLGDLSGQCS